MGCARQRASPPRSGGLRCGLFVHKMPRGSQIFIGASHHVCRREKLFCQESRDRPRNLGESRELCWYSNVFQRSSYHHTTTTTTTASKSLPRSEESTGTGRDVAIFGTPKKPKNGLKRIFRPQRRHFLPPGGVRAAARLPAAQRRLTVWPICPQNA